jgi:hypothetical protein
MTIPINIRQAMQGNGDNRAVFFEIEPGRLERLAATHSITDVKKMFGQTGKHASIEDMNCTIAA